MLPTSSFLFFFFNDTATTEIYTLSLHDALPISMIDAQSSSFMRISRLSRVMPALLTRIEIGPNSLAIPSDRKSTRLNSSHSQISYAVFCLKKKKKKEKYIDRHRARQQLLKDSER